MATRSALRLLILAPLAVSSLPGSAYTHLITVRDGSLVFAQVRTGLLSANWYRIPAPAPRPSAIGIANELAASSDDGAILATTFFSGRRCGAPGSTCFLSAPCRASFLIEGPGVKVEGAGRPTSVALSRDGRLAWIEQSGECRGLGDPPPAPERRGLYQVPSLIPVFAGSGLTAASPRPGIRSITARGQALVLATDRGLRLVDLNGPRPLPHQFEVREAVIDSEGRNIVYATPASRLRWIDLASGAEADLAPGGVTGQDPLLSDDGRTLAFLSPAGDIQLYRRDTGRLDRLPFPGAPFAAIALSGDARYLFAASVDNRLLRIDLQAGAAQTWLDPMAEIEDLSAPISTDPSSCPLVCYHEPERMLQVSPTQLVVLSGRSLTHPGWRVAFASFDLPLTPLSDRSVWFQVPGAAEPSGRVLPLRLFHPDLPLEFRASLMIASQVVTCFGALDSSFSRLVDSTAPARPGDIVHVFLSGFRGVEPVPDGVPNPSTRLIPVLDPPPLAGDNIFEPLFFGLAPGYVGLQQLDLRILNPTRPGLALFPPPWITRGCQMPPTAP